MKRGSIIIEATIVVTLILLIVAIGLREIVLINQLVDSYFESQASDFNSVFEESVEVMRIEKSIQDGQ